MQGNIKIDRIVIEHIIDTTPDISWLGEYTSDLKEGIIVRQYDKFYEDLTEEELEEINIRTREHTGFNPYAGGEKVGTENYRECGMWNYERMEQINNGDSWFIGITATAVIHAANSNVIQHIHSGGLWGIDSDNNVYIKEIENEQLSDLKEQLKAFSIDTTNFDTIKIERKN